MNSDVQRVVNLVRMGEIRQIESNPVLKDIFERLKNEGIVSFKKVTEIKVSTDPNNKNYPKPVEKWGIDNPKLLKSKYGAE